MNTNTSNKRSISHFAAPFPLTLAAGLCSLFLGAAQLRAQSYWDGTGTTWNAGANWSTSSSATTPNPAIPGIAIDAVFNITTLNTDQTVNLDANQSIRSLTFNSTGTTLLRGGGTNRTLSLYGNITLGAGAGAATIGSDTAGQNASLTLFGAQNWTAAAGTTLTVVNPITRSGGTVNVGSTGTFGGAGLLDAATTTVQGWITSGNDWAVSDGSKLVANTSYDNDTWGSGNNTTVTGSSAPSADSTTNSLRFNAAGPATLTLAGTNTLTSGGILVTSNVGDNANAITGGTLAGASGRDLVVIQNNTASAFTINSTIANNGTATGLTKSGAGELILNNSNTFTGAVNVNSGTLTLADGASLTGIAASNLNGGTLRINSGASWSGASLTSTAASTVIIDGGSYAQTGVLGNSAKTLAITMNLNSGSVALSGVGGNNWIILNMTGGTFSVGGTVFDGLSDSVISGGIYTNTSSNAAVVRAGSLTINGTGSYNVNRFAIVGNGESLKVDGGSMTVTGDRFFIGNNSFSGARAGHIAQTGGTVSMADAEGLIVGNTTGALLAASLYDYRLSGGTLTLQKITLAPNTYVGLGTNAFKMSGGTLDLGAGGIVTGGGTGTKLIEISGGTIGATANWSSSLDMSLLTVGTGGLAGLGNGTATFRADNGAETPTARDIALSGILSGAGSLIKTGEGQLTLSADNTYTGATTVNAGTLLVSAGNINGTSGVSVSGAGSNLRYDSATALSRTVTVTGGGTFAYNSAANYSGTLALTNGELGGTNWNGTLGGLTIGSNQTISPGNSVGTANTTSQTWAGGGAFDWEINKADGIAGDFDGGWDLLNLSDTLSISATSESKFTINIISLGLNNLAGNAAAFSDASDYNWLFASTANPISGFALDKFAINTTGFSNEFTGNFSVVLGDTVSGGTANQLYIAYTVIPEPSSMLLLGLVALVLVLRRLRRREAQ